MFELNFGDNILKKWKNFVSDNKKLEKKFDVSFDNLEKNPYYPSLKTHKVIRNNGEKAFSSRITGDLRIIWDYSQNEIQVLDILDIGGHSGKNKVYK